jgi:polysaccharide export outer membrane protein
MAQQACSASLFLVACCASRSFAMRAEVSQDNPVFSPRRFSAMKLNTPAAAILTCVDRVARVGRPAWLGAAEDIGVTGRSARVGALALGCVLTACVSGQTLPPAPATPMLESIPYRIGPGDAVSIFVWRNPELSITTPIRPDGVLSMPLVQDIVAIGDTPAELARKIETRLAKYITDPIVTVIPTRFVGPFSYQVRIIGEAAAPRALPYRESMTLLDAMIEVGGLTKYAAGNRATLIRTVNGAQSSYQVFLDSLIKQGDIDANVALLPGDIIIIPQTYF